MKPWHSLRSELIALCDHHVNVLTATAADTAADTATAAATVTAAADNETEEQPHAGGSEIDNSHRSLSFYSHNPNAILCLDPNQLSNMLKMSPSQVKDLRREVAKAISCDDVVGNGTWNANTIDNGNADGNGNGNRMTKITDSDKDIGSGATSNDTNTNEDGTTPDPTQSHSFIPGATTLLQSYLTKKEHQRNISDNSNSNYPRMQIQTQSISTGSEALDQLLRYAQYKGGSDNSGRKRPRSVDDDDDIMIHDHDRNRDEDEDESVGESVGAGVGVSVGAGVGGVPFSRITQVSGPSPSGKTQLAISLCCHAITNTCAAGVNSNSNTNTNTNTNTNMIPVHVPRGMNDGKNHNVYALKTSKSDSDSDTHIDNDLTPSNILAGSNLGFIENGTTSNNINNRSSSSSNNSNNSGSHMTMNSVQVEAGTVSSTSISSAKHEEEVVDGKEIDKKHNSDHNALSQTHTVSDNRTKKSSTSKSSIQRAVRFLHHPSIAGMSTADKDAYLHSKGLTKADIQQANWIANQPMDMDVDRFKLKTKKEEYDDSFEGAWGSSKLQPQKNSGSRNISTNQNREAKGTAATATSTPTPSPTHVNSQHQKRLQNQQQQQQQQQQTHPQQNQHHHQHPNNQHNANGEIQTYNQNNNPMGRFGTATANTPPTMNSMNNMNMMMEPQLDLPNPLVPMTLGGVIAVFGIAVLRWLNGGEFELFPPSSPGPVEDEDEGNKSKAEEFGSARIGSDMSQNNHMMPIEEEYDEDGDNADDIIDDDDGGDGMLEEYEEMTNSTTARATAALNEELDSNHGHGLARDLQSLTLAIEKYTALQEETIKTQFEEKANKSTNNLMDLLKKKQQMKGKEEDTSSGGAAIEDLSGTTIQQFLQDKTIGLAMLVQLTEVKCSLKVMSHQFSSISSTHDNKSNDGDGDGDCGIIGENLVLRKLDEIRTQLQTIESKLIGSNANGEEETIDLKQSPTVETVGPSNVSSMKDEVGNKGSSSDDDDARIEAETEESAASKEVPIKNSKVNESTTGLPKESNKGKDSKEKGNASSPQNSDENESKDDSGGGSEKKATVQVGKEALQDALCSMKELNETIALKTCCQMLYLYVSNLSANPNSKQYQKIYTKNSTFKKKVGNVKFAKDVLLSVGFVDEGSFFLWKKEDNCNGDSANGDVSLLKDAVDILKQFQKKL